MTRVLDALLIGAVVASPVRSAALEVPDDFVVKLERTICGGECPAYWVSIDARGNVVYEGTEFVRVQGRQTDKVPASRVAAIFAAGERIGFFNLRDQYLTIRHSDGTESFVTDRSTAFLTITRAGQSKRIENYIGAPQALNELARLVDDTARIRR